MQCRKVGELRFASVGSRHQNCLILCIEVQYRNGSICLKKWREYIWCAGYKFPRRTKIIGKQLHSSWAGRRSLSSSLGDYSEYQEYIDCTPSAERDREMWGFKGTSSGGFEC